jgi:hypothetical protein
MSTPHLIQHSMVTRSMTKAALEQETTEKLAKSKIPKKDLTDKVRDEDKYEILTESELLARGLTPNYCEGKRLKVIRALDLDMLVVGFHRDYFRDKYAVAPKGWYWKEYSEKCYFNFDWYELERIPKKRKKTY